MADEHRQRFEAIIVLLHRDPPQVRFHRGHGERPALPVENTAQLPGLLIDVVDDEQFPASASQRSRRGGDQFRALDQQEVVHGIHCRGGHVDLAVLAVLRARLHGEFHRLARPAPPDPQFGQ